MKDTIDVLAVMEFHYATDGVMVERIKQRGVRCDRPDDANESIIRNRFEVYRAETEPMLKCFPDDRVHRINADAAPVEVARHLLDVLIPAIRIPTAVYND